MDWTQKRIEQDRTRFLHRRPPKPSAEVKVNRNPHAHIVAKQNAPIPCVAPFGRYGARSLSAGLRRRHDAKTSVDRGFQGH
jgi:hypothetical protein